MKEREEEGQGESYEDLVNETADILEEIEVEDLTVDGICGVY